MESKVKTLINAVSASKVGPLSRCLPSSREEGVWIHVVRAPTRATPTACLVVMLVHSECLWPEHLLLGPASKHCWLGIKELPSVIALTCLPQGDLRFHLSGSPLSIWAPDLDQRRQGNFDPWVTIGWQRQRLFFLGCNPFYIRRGSHLLESSQNPTQPIIWYSLPPNCLFNMFPFILKAKPPPLSICAVQKAFSPQLPTRSVTSSILLASNLSWRVILDSSQLNQSDGYDGYVDSSANAILPSALQSLRLEKPVPCLFCLFSCLPLIHLPCSSPARSLFFFCLVIMALCCHLKSKLFYCL